MHFYFRRFTRLQDSLEWAGTRNATRPREQRSAHIPSKVIATCFALVAFAAAVAVGVAAGVDATTIIWRAMLVMAVAWVLGRILGEIAVRIVQERIDDYKLRHPIPALKKDAVASGAAAAGTAAAAEPGAEERASSEANA